jgi:G3E family GTPase
VTDYAALIPVNVVTGFLGSGKTTLLSRLLKSPRLRDTAVLVNELGEVGLDHHLLGHVSESTLLLDNGCVCCAMRGDLQEALRDLFSRRERDEVPRFRRVAIETSGLADPVPIAYTVLTEPVIQHHFRLGNVVTVVDAVNGAAELERYPESVKQAAVADRLVLTKTDLCEPSDLGRLRTALKRLNAAAPVLDAAVDEIDPEHLLADDIYDREGKAREVRRWFEAEAASGGGHEPGIASFALRFAAPLDWTAPGARQRGAAHRPSARSPGALARRGPLVAPGLHRPRHVPRPDRTIPRRLQRPRQPGRCG